MAQILTDSSPSISSLNMTPVLPRYIVLESEYNNKYLRYINEDTEVHGFLKFSGEMVVSPYSKIEVEHAKSGKGLVHLRCCYNNKYWVKRSSTDNTIVAGGDKKEENQSMWSCTLFEPEFIDNKTIRLRHVQVGHYVVLLRDNNPTFYAVAYAGWRSTDKDKCDRFSIIDWESLVILPKHVAFKGDNGKYLSACMIKDNPYNQFASDDIGDPTVGYAITTTRDGSVRIKSDHFKKFWRRSPNWIWVDSDDHTSNNPDTLFWPVKVDNNIIALRNLGNHHFCMRLTTDGKTNCLNAGVSTISKEAHLEVEELVISRKVYDVDFRLMDARTYNQHVITMATGTAVNETTASNTMGVKLSYKETKTRTWDTSISLKLGIKTTFEAGIPIIGEGEIEIASEFTGEYKWGDKQEITSQVDTVYDTTVLPKTRVRVSLLATIGSCDVPFSYSNHDTLITGKQINYRMHDGVYSGINSFNFNYETKQEPL